MHRKYGEKYVIEFKEKEFALLKYIMSNARLNIETREEIDSQDRKAIKLINKIMETK